MIEQIQAAFAESSATLQSLRIEPTGVGNTLHAHMTYEPGYFFRETHLISLISLSQYRVVEAKVAREENLIVTVAIYPNVKAA